jgi:hypothetical protein
MQSLQFYGTQTLGVNDSNLVVPYNADYDFGTGDFTIEWWQKMDADIGNAPRIFSIGDSNLSTVEISVSVEESSVIFWLSTGPIFFDYPDQVNYRIPLLGSWHHFAVVRHNDSLSMYLDGTALTTGGDTSIANSEDYIFSPSKNICIGDQTNVNVYDFESFKGLLNSIVWRVGTATYTGNFQVPTSQPTLASGTSLLLNGAEGGLYTSTEETITNNNVGTGVADNPYSAPLSEPSPSSDPYVFNKKGLLNQQSGSQVAARRRAGTLNTVQQNYMNNRIYNNKAAYAGTNDGYNAWHSLTRVRNMGATVPAKAQGGLGPLRVNTFFGQTGVAGSATKDAKSSQTLDRNVPNEGRQNF